MSMQNIHSGFWTAQLIHLFMTLMQVSASSVRTKHHYLIWRVKNAVNAERERVTTLRSTNVWNDKLLGMDRFSILSQFLTS